MAVTEMGVVVDAEDMSTTWIDGAFARVLQRTGFVESVRRGEVPSPVFSALVQATPTRILYTSPMVLAERDCTILDALGLTESVCNTALSSGSIRCLQCGEMMKRLRHPLALLEALIRDFSREKITIRAESSSASLAEWATRHGFSIHTVSNSLSSIVLDEIECSADSMRKLVPSVRALWRIPKLEFECFSHEHRSRYSRHGWCNRCEQSNEAISRAALLQLISKGFSSADATRPELQLSMEGTTFSLETLLTTPIGRINTEFPLAIQHQLRALADLKLDHLTLGTPLRRLSAQVLTLLSAFITIKDSKQQEGVVIIEIPRGSLTEKQTTHLRTFTERECRDTPVVYIHDERTSSPNQQHPYEERSRNAPLQRSVGTLALATSDSSTTERIFDLQLGERIRIDRAPEEPQSLFHDVCDAFLDKTPVDTRRVRIEKAHPFEVTSLPVFNPMRESKRMVLDEVGFAEPLARLYAASLDARSLGLSLKDFLITSSRRNPHLCPACRGLGVHLSVIPQLSRPHAEPCHTCTGLRFKAPVSRMLFRGSPLAAILNQSIEESTPLLSALYRSKDTLDLMRSLYLTHLSLGMPLSLLHERDQRAIGIVRALAQAKPTKPAILLIEEPHALLSDAQIDGLEMIHRDPRFRELTCWIEVASCRP